MALDLDPPIIATSHYRVCHFRYNLALTMSILYLLYAFYILITYAIILAAAGMTVACIGPVFMSSPSTVKFPSLKFK